MRMRTPIARPSLASLLAALLLPWGCGGSPAPAPPARPRAAVARPAPQRVSPPEPAPPDPPSPFSPVIVHGPRSLQFFPLKRFGVAVAAEYNPVPLRVDDRGARIDRGLYAGIREGLEGNVFSVDSIRGDLPAEGSLDLFTRGDRSGGSVSFTWKGSRWERDPSSDLPLDAPMEINQAYYSGSILGTAHWEGRTLYELVETGSDGTLEIKFVLGGKGKSPPPPRLTPGDGSCSTKLLAHADLTTLPSGEVIGFGKVCTEGATISQGNQISKGPLAVERWPRGSRKAILDILPGSEGGAVLTPGNRFVVHGSKDVHLYANLAAAEGERERAYLAHYDGKSWTQEPIGAEESIRRLYRTPDGATWIELETEVRRQKKGGAWEALVPPGPRARLEWTRRAPDGTLWAGQGDALLHLTAEDRWEKVPLPRIDGRFPVPQGVHWIGPADMFVVAANPERSETYLLRTRAPERILDYKEALAALPDEPEPEEGTPAAPADAPDADANRAGAREPSAFGRVTPGSPACKDLFVVLYKLAKVAPPDYDCPLTRAALKGHTELEGLSFAETEDGGRRYFVAFAPSFDKAHRLAQIVRDGVKGSTPQVLCGKPPKTNRALRIDLRTGDLLR